MIKEGVMYVEVRDGNINDEFQKEYEEARDIHRNKALDWIEMEHLLEFRRQGADLIVRTGSNPVRGERMARQKGNTFYVYHRGAEAAAFGRLASSVQEKIKVANRRGIRWYVISFIGEKGSFVIYLACRCLLESLSTAPLASG